jgi:DNA-binding transcriptional ArsR family regulator
MPARDRQGAPASQHERTDLHHRAMATAAEAKALGHPIRLRILSLCHSESLTNKELADRLHLPPASVLHHVRTLVKSGFLVAEEERPGPRGSTLRPFRATGKSWALEVSAPEDTANTKLAAVEAAVQEIRSHPGADLGPLVLCALRLDRSKLEELLMRFAEELDEIDAQTAATDQPAWNVLVTTYPAAR